MSTGSDDERGGDAASSGGRDQKGIDGQPDSSDSRLSDLTRSDLSPTKQNISADIASDEIEEFLGHAAHGAGSSRASDVITNIERLSTEERTMLDRALHAAQDSDGSLSQTSQTSGVVVGALRGSQPAWDVRPLLLDTAVSRDGGARSLHLVRLSHPEAYLDPQRKGFLEQLLGAIERGLSSDSVHEALSQGVFSCGMARGQLWIRRPYFESVLSDLDVGGRASEEKFQNVLFAQRLITLITTLQSEGLIHGHICPQNIAVIDEHPILIDYGFYVLDAKHLQFSGFAAPELARSPVPTVATDVFGLGKVLRRLLSESLSSEHRVFLDSMCHPDPERRPDMRVVRERFIPAERVRVTPSAREPRAGARREIATERQHNIRSGKLLGREGEVSARSSVADRGTQNPSSRSQSGASSISALQSAELQKSENVSPAQSVATGETLKQAKNFSRLIAHIAPVSRRVRGSIVALLVGTLLGVAIWSFYTPYSERVLQYQHAWESAEVDERFEVVHAALYDDDSAAQDVIMEDVATGTRRPGVRLGLLRVAFNSLWAEELNSDDRKQALIFSLASLMRTPSPKGVPLRDIHPGVQLAAIGDLDFTLSEGQFDDIPVSSLANLPPPYGPPFIELEKLGVKSMGDLRARALAHIVVGNLGDDAVTKFVGSKNPPDEFLAHALVVAPFAELYPDVARQLSVRMRERDDIFTRRSEWFRSDPAGHWASMPEATQVALALGIFPNDTLADERLADLLSFPSARVRKSAVAALVKNFDAPQVDETLQFIAGDEHRLTRPQIVLLVSALILGQREPQNPSVGSFLSTWFRTNPDPQSVLVLLTSRRAIESPASGPDPFNIEATRYLSTRNWDASIAQLRALVFHREKLARAMAYSRMDAAISEERALLEEAVRSEDDVRLRTQILGKLKSAEVLRSLPSRASDGGGPSTGNRTSKRHSGTTFLEPLPEVTDDGEVPADGGEELDSPI